MSTAAANVFQDITREVSAVLSPLDREILAGIPSNWSMGAKHYPQGRDNATRNEVAAQWTGAIIDTPSAVIVYTDERNEIQMGVCRGRREQQGTVYYEISPFPGAWDSFVPESAILAVRSTQAM